MKPFLRDACNLGKLCEVSLQVNVQSRTETGSLEYSGQNRTRRSVNEINV